MRIPVFPFCYCKKQFLHLFICGGWLDKVVAWGVQKWLRCTFEWSSYWTSNCPFKCLLNYSGASLPYVHNSCASIFTI